MSCCPLPKNSASAASTVLVKASFWAGEEANSRFVFKPVKVPFTPKSTSAVTALDTERPVNYRQWFFILSS